MQEFRRILGEIQAHQELVSNYQKTLALLHALKAGTMTMENIVLVPGGWQILDVKIEGESAAEAPANQET